MVHRPSPAGATPPVSEPPAGSGAHRGNGRQEAAVTAGHAPGPPRRRCDAAAGRRDGADPGPSGTAPSAGRRRAGARSLVLLRRLAIAASALPALAWAEEQPLWELGLGVGALRLPHYRGSDQDHTWLLPVPYLVYRGEVLKSDREGARAVLLERGRVVLDLSLAAGLRTRSEDDEARRGMDELASTVELGPSLNWSLARGAGWKLDLRAPVRAALTVASRPEMIGWTATPHLRLGLRRGEDWNVSLQAGPVWGSRRYHAYFYGVPAADSTAERPAYQAPSGFGGGQATATWSRRIANAWIGGFLRYDTLHGAVFDDSPLVREREQLSFGVALTWVFARSDRWVEVDETR